MIILRFYEINFTLKLYFYFQPISLEYLNKIPIEQILFTI